MSNTTKSSHLLTAAFAAVLLLICACHAAPVPSSTIHRTFEALSAAGAKGANQEELNAILYGNDGTRNGLHDGTNVNTPLVSDPSLNIWGNSRGYKAFGHVNFPVYSNTPRMPAYMYVDPEQKIFVLYHNTTLHRIIGNEGTISARVAPAGCAGLGGLFAGDMCTWRTEMNMDEWAQNYTLSMRTDNQLVDVRDVRIRRQLRGPRNRMPSSYTKLRNTKVREFIGLTKDHHVSLALPVNKHTLSARIELFEDRQMEGAIRKWTWNQLVLGGANLQSFEVVFDTYDFAPLVPADYAAPDWFPNVLNADMPIYPL